MKIIETSRFQNIKTNQSHSFPTKLFLNQCRHSSAPEFLANPILPHLLMSACHQKIKKQFERFSTDTSAEKD